MLIQARKLLSFSTTQLWDILTGEFELQFDDGEIIETNDKETLYSSYTWDFHRIYPNTPLLKKHHLKDVLKGKPLGSKTHMVHLGAVMWDAYRHNPVQGIGMRDEMARLIYRITNEIYNDLSIRLGEYVTSIDILDFIGITEHPDVKETLDTLPHSQQGIEIAYSSLTKLMNDKNATRYNPICKAVRAKLVNDNQVLQCVGPRGFLTDIDSTQFQVPVMVGYVKGIRKIYDSAVESRSSAKSLFFSKEPLQEAEYFSRRLQLLCQVVRNLHEGDCGSTNYVLWKVRPPLKDNDKTLRDGDLKNLVGKYYIKDDGSLEVIKENDTQLHNTTIKLRSVVAGCHHPDPYGVCSVCFGELSKSVPDRSNLGHMCSTSMTQQSSQSVLSVKHLDGSSVIDGIVLNSRSRLFFKTSKDQMSYVLLPELKKQYDRIQLSFTPAEAIGFLDVNNVQDVKDLMLSRVCELTTINVKTITNDAVSSTPVDVSVKNRKASLTYEFLQYMKDVGWWEDNQHQYCVDLSGWDYSKEIMVLPQKHENMADHAKTIASMIESKVKALTDGENNTTPSATLAELFDLVNSKLNVNLAVLEIILYACMVVSVEDNDYRLPKGNSRKQLGVAKMTIPNRSLSAAMAYEGHRNTLFSPLSFYSQNRPSHPMDVFLMPEETMRSIGM